MKQMKRLKAMSGELRHCENCLGSLAICEQCNPLRRYCSSHCRLEARRAKHRLAVRKYSQSDKGRVSLRLKQKLYRTRLRRGTNVTDHYPIKLRQPVQKRVLPLAGMQYRRNLTAFSQCHFCKRHPLYFSTNWKALWQYAPRPISSLRVQVPPLTKPTNI